MSRFETEVLTRPTKVEALIDLSGKCVAQVRQKKPFQRLIFDMDRSVSPTHGDQQRTAYNGHFERTCDRPQFLFNQHGGLERVLLRNGNVHRDDDWRSILEPVVACYREETSPEFFRADGVFAYPQN